MFLRCSKRKKNGKEHRYWSIVENKRVAGDRIVQRHVLYLGEINGGQREEWQKSIEVFEDGRVHPRTMALLADDESVESTPNQFKCSGGGEVVRVRLSQMELRRPRQWGACWLACHLYGQLGLDEFFAQCLPPSRKGTRWDLILKTLCCYRLIDPGSEWRLHRQWFERSAMGDLLGEDFSLAEIHKLYECHDRLLEHKAALFSHLQERWKDLFNARFEVLLYDLTSTYFESNPPFGENDKRQFGYSRDKRSDCVQVVIALVVTPEGFPLGYEVMSGNTSDKTTLREFLQKIETQYGKADRIWVMDRGIPTEEVLAEMRASDPPVSYLVGTPKGRLGKLETQLTDLPWQQVREGIDVKLLPQDGELYVFAQSRDRVGKERAMRRRALRKLLKRLAQLRAMTHLKRDELLLKLGAAQADAGRVYRLLDITIPEPRQPVNAQTFTFSINRTKQRDAAPIYAIATSVAFYSWIQRHVGCARPAAAKAATSCAVISAPMPPKNSGLSTCNSATSKKPSKPSRAISPCDPSITNWNNASKLISSSPSSPIASKSPSAAACAISPPDSPRVRSSKNSLPSK
jgi:hypothetical protein